MKVSVLIPIKNEPYINTLSKKIHKELSRIKHEIIIIEKGNTGTIVKNAKIIQQKSDGLGNAVLEGLKYATGDIVVLMDGDGSHRPEDIPRLLEKINKYDIIIGSRFIKGGETRDKTHRKIISLFFRKLSAFILGLDIEDTMSGFSAVKMKVYKSLQLNPLGYKINLETLYKGKKRGYKIIEVPIIFLKRKYGHSKVEHSLNGIKEAFRIIRYIIELKLGIR